MGVFDPVSAILCESVIVCYLLDSSFIQDYECRSWRLIIHSRWTKEECVVSLDRFDRGRMNGFHFKLIRNVPICVCFVFFLLTSFVCHYFCKLVFYYCVIVVCVWYYIIVCVFGIYYFIVVLILLIMCVYTFFYCVCVHLLFLLLLMTVFVCVFVITVCDILHFVYNMCI